MKKLPAPNLKGVVSIEEALAKRRSLRAYTSAPLTDAELSQLLWAAQGTTFQGRQFRTAPSAGAAFPIELYAINQLGVFHYKPKTHTLQVVSTNDVRKDLAQTAFGQTCLRTAALVMAFAVEASRTTVRYGDRGIVYVHIEVGHAAQNVHLQAVALGLASVPLGAFDPKEAGKILNLPVGEQLLYLLSVGRPARQKPNP